MHVIGGTTRELVRLTKISNFKLLHFIEKFYFAETEGWSNRRGCILDERWVVALAKGAR